MVAMGEISVCLTFDFDALSVWIGRAAPDHRT
jgi:hypothetical protein